MKTKRFTPQSFSLPSALTQIQQHWQHWDGICRVDDAPAGDTPPAETPPPTSNDELAEIREALRKERELRSQYEKDAKAKAKQLEVYGGIDPEKAKRAEEILKEMEERSQWESKIRAEAEAQFQPKLTEYQKQLQEKEQSLLNFKRDVLLQEAFYKSGGFEGEFEAIAHNLHSRAQVQPDGSIKVLDDKGQPMFIKGEPATVADLMADMKEKHTWFARHFRDTTKPGFGINGTGQQPAPAQLEGLDPWEKVARIREANQGRA